MTKLAIIATITAFAVAARSAVAEALTSLPTTQAKAFSDLQSEVAALTAQLTQKQTDLANLPSLQAAELKAAQDAVEEFDAKQAEVIAYLTTTLPDDPADTAADPVPSPAAA